MIRFLTLSLLTASVLGTVGCVPNETNRKYEALQNVNRSLVQQLSDAERSRAEMEQTLVRRNQELDQSKSEIDRITTDYDGLSTKWDTLAQRNDTLARHLTALEIGELPEDMEAALSAIAASNPDQISFDPNTGMLRFSSDLTFASGSDQLRAGSDTPLAAVAKIISSPTAVPLEVLVVGHTDDVPVTHSRQAHPSNLHLSVHRAIAVRNALVNAGVTAEQVRVAGDGQFHPLVVNTTGGTAENRRVEIYLVPAPRTETIVEVDTTSQDAFNEPMK
ncbi:MAG: OmpA family protein [Phycisphaerae bacterium]|jgi:chemotaxis protein MotB|nr:OmpA family protein [Phycisphaerae bacterium]MBT5583939.1 OmpA family protein [Phycisphaerae bacterium]MBT5657994.1 OmpA family protein [Phycisphaerae bacterium]